MMRRKEERGRERNRKLKNGTRETKEGGVLVITRERERER